MDDCSQALGKGMMTNGLIPTVGGEGPLGMSRL